MSTQHQADHVCSSVRVSGTLPVPSPTAHRADEQSPRWLVLSVQNSLSQQLALPTFGFVAVAALLLVAAPQAQGASYSWIVPSGDWSLASNWGGISPGPSDNAYIINGGTANITATSWGYCSNLYLGDPNSSNSGTVQMSGGGLTSLYGSEYVGNIGAGTFLQSGGLNNAGGELCIGNAFGGVGAYSLTNSGLLTVQNEYVGSAATFAQTGGTNTMPETSMSAGKATQLLGTSPTES